jgi:hypothetical protein
VADQETYDELAIPPGAEVLGVFVDGVPLTPREDYEVLDDRIRLAKPVRRRTSVSLLGKILLSLGVGVYNKGNVVDLQVRSGGQTSVVRGRPLAEQR